MKGRTYVVALGGVLAAAAALLVILGSVFPYLSLALPALAGILLIPAVLDVGCSGAVLMYAAVSVLSLLLAPSKETVIYYLFFFGYYPILKNLIERLKSRPLQWILKLALFNVCATAAYFVFSVFFGLPDIVAKYGYLPILAALNAAFVLYDIAVTQLIATYVFRIRKALFKK